MKKSESELFKVMKKIEKQTDEKPYVIMVYKVSELKPIFKQAITCKCEALVKRWLLENNYKKNKKEGYWESKNGKKIANVLPTKNYIG